MGEADRERTPQELAVLKKLHSACKGLPGVTEERDGFGHTTLKVGKKSIAILGDDGGRAALAIKTDTHTQAALTKRGGYHRTPYIGQHGWVSVDAGGPFDWEEIGELLVDAYRSVAPKKLLRELDEQRG